jgi:hypothetical protein
MVVRSLMVPDIAVVSRQCSFFPGRPPKAVTTGDFRELAACTTDGARTTPLPIAALEQGRLARSARPAYEAVNIGVVTPTKLFDGGVVVAVTPGVIQMP